METTTESVEEIPEDELCVDCLKVDKKELGSVDWELYHGDQPLCCDCISERHRGMPVPQEWIIDKDPYW